MLYDRKTKNKNKKRRLSHFLNEFFKNNAINQIEIQNNKHNLFVIENIKKTLASIKRWQFNDYEIFLKSLINKYVHNDIETQGLYEEIFSELCESNQSKFCVLQLLLSYKLLSLLAEEYDEKKINKSKNEKTPNELDNWKKELTSMKKNLWVEIKPILYLLNSFSSKNQLPINLDNDNVQVLRHKLNNIFYSKTFNNEEYILINNHLKNSSKIVNKIVNCVYLIQGIYCTALLFILYIYRLDGDITKEQFEQALPYVTLPWDWLL